MIVEMPGHQRHINVTRLADRLAIVQGFQDREKPGMLLYQPRQRIKHPRAALPAHACPLHLRRPCGGHRSRNVAACPLADLGQHLARRRVAGFKHSARRGEGAIDPMPKAPLMARNPGKRLGIALGGRAISHAVENRSHAGHLLVLSANGIARHNPAPAAGVFVAKMKMRVDFILAKMLRGEPRNAARGSAPDVSAALIQPIAWRLAAE